MCGPIHQYVIAWAPAAAWGRPPLLLQPLTWQGVVQSRPLPVGARQTGLHCWRRPVHPSEVFYALAPTTGAAKDGR